VVNRYVSWAGKGGIRLLIDNDGSLQMHHQLSLSLLALTRAKTLIRRKSHASAVAWDYPRYSELRKSMAVSGVCGTDCPSPQLKLFPPALLDCILEHVPDVLSHRASNCAFFACFLV
jgi:hypothetical protein